MAGRRQGPFPRRPALGVVCTGVPCTGALALRGRSYACATTGLPMGNTAAYPHSGLREGGGVYAALLLPVPYVTTLVLSVVVG